MGLVNSKVLHVWYMIGLVDSTIKTIDITPVFWTTSSHNFYFSRKTQI